jgi:hypothetical protein
VIERDRLFDDYYEPFLNLLGDQAPRVGAADVLSRIPELDIAIGIEAGTYNLVRQRAYADLMRHTADFPAHEDTPRRKIGLDGVVVELGPSWLAGDGSLIHPLKE